MVEERNLVDVVEVHPDDDIVMVDHIKPSTPEFKARAKALYILERSPLQGGGRSS